MTQAPAQPAFRVGDWTAIPARRLLRSGDGEITLEPRVMDLLICLARHQGDVVSRDRLVEEVWHGTIVSDSPIYQTLAKLRKALGDDHHAPRYIETIAKRGYRLIAAVTWDEPGAEDPAAGEPESAAAAVAPDSSLAAQAPADLGPAPSHALPAKRSLGSMLVLVLVTTLYIFLASSDTATSIDPRDDEAAAARAIAVLPFVDMSEGGGKAYLGDGIAEQLIHTLSALPELRVIARTSSFAFRDDDVDAVTIASELNVGLILEGSIRTAGDQIRVSAQLVDGRDAFHIWSRTFEQPIGDVFDIQDAIARDVAALILGEKIAQGMGPVRYATHDPQAWELFLLGQHQMEFRRAETLERAIDYFEQAIDLDPTFALAYARLSFAWFLASDRRYGKVPEDESIDQAELAVQQALAIDERLPQAWRALVAVCGSRGDRDGANEAALRAYELDPGSAEANAAYSAYLEDMGREEEALAAMERAVELDPLKPNIRLNLADRYSRYGRPARSEEELERVLEIAPDWHMPFMAAARSAFHRSKFDEAVRHGSHAATVEGPDARLAHTAAWVTANAWLALGEYETAREWLGYAEDGGKPRWWADNVEIRIRLAEGRLDEAHALLQRWVARIPTDEDCCLWHLMLNSNADAWAYAAWIEMLIGHDDHARGYLDRAAAAAGSMVNDPAIAPEFDAANWPLVGNDLISWGYLPTNYRALLLRRSGREDEALAMVDRGLRFLEALSSKPLWVPGSEPALGLRYAMAGAYAVRGETDTALALLRAAVDEGWMRPLLLEKDPILDSLRGRPAFFEISRRVEDRLLAQRQSLDEGTALARAPARP
jgi:TolB-like protein/DNA-binding winged helix-turn-helix (wHTH) protein/Flp pilus assembly protein TadD